MKKTVKGMVVCTMLSTMFTMPTAAFANDPSCSTGKCTTGAVQHTETWDSNCEYYAIPQPAKEECVPVYTCEQKEFTQPDITTFEPRQITETKTMTPPPIVQIIPRIKRTKEMIPQPNQIVRIPVVTYKEVSIPQPAKEMWRECVTTEKVVIPQKPVCVTETRYEFVPKTEAQETKSVTLTNATVERQVTEQPSMQICMPDVQVKTPEGCTPAPSCDDPCSKKATCEPKKPSCDKSACLIRNNTELTQTLTFAYYYGVKKYTSKITLKAGATHMLKMQSRWYSKQLILGAYSMKAKRGSEILLASMIKAS